MNPWLRKHGYARRALVCFSNVKPHRSAGRQVFGAGRVGGCSRFGWLAAQREEPCGAEEAGGPHGPGAEIPACDQGSQGPEGPAWSFPLLVRTVALPRAELSVWGVYMEPFTSPCCQISLVRLKLEETSEPTRSRMELPATAERSPRTPAAPPVSPQSISAVPGAAPAAGHCSQAGRSPYASGHRGQRPAAHPHQPPT
uniref:Uncharacterized protein n=1 Tax=Rangifer tarandus platyrhynchus TaxID=3082113 RepID=A0ACB0E8J6_RANTA|nr:unnamed protein product [Rangifer tarandus platyrhynchus]